MDVRTSLGKSDSNRGLQLLAAFNRFSGSPINVINNLAPKNIAFNFSKYKIIFRNVIFSYFNKFN